MKISPETRKVAVKPDNTDCGLLYGKRGGAYL
jgi:hypothetical protein